MTNEQIVEILVKKGIITADALAGAGKLNPKQADRFLDYVFDLSKLKNIARMVKFSPESMEIDRIGIGDRVAWPKALAKAPQVRQGVSHSKIALTPVEVIVPFEIGQVYKEINIEGDKVEDHIVQLFAKQFNNNLEQMYIRADTLGEAVLEGDLIDGGSTTGYIKDPLMALITGWLRRADASNLVDNGGVNVSDSTFGAMLRALPEKYKRDLDQMVFLAPSNLEQLYRERTGTRATPAGDEARSSRGRLTPYGVTLDTIPLMQFYPTIVEHLTMPGGATPVSLRYNPVLAGSDVVTLQTLDLTPTLPYTGGGVDYTFDDVNGTITPAAALFGANVKVTYQAFPQVLLTVLNNLIVGIGRDITVERARDIYSLTDQWVMHAKVAVQIENDEAIVKAHSIGDDI